MITKTIISDSEVSVTLDKTPVASCSNMSVYSGGSHILLDERCILFLQFHHLQCKLLLKVSSNLLPREDYKHTYSATKY
jgi:hypothetical protein